MLNQITSLLYKDFVLERRLKHTINGLVIYTLSTSFIIYFAYNQPEPTTWIANFWIILLFVSINAIAKGFSQEKINRLAYYYTIASPIAVLISKVIYNTLLLLLLSIVFLIIYSLTSGYPIFNNALFMTIVLLGSISFAITLTCLSLIAAKTSNSNTLMAVLSFPVIIPIILLLIKLSKASLLDISILDVSPDIGIVASIDTVTLAVSYILFPYLWTD